jgi:hypothetical protein
MTPGSPSVRMMALRQGLRNNISYFAPCLNNSGIQIYIHIYFFNISKLKLYVLREPLPAMPAH